VSARKHGVADADIRHALRNWIRVADDMTTRTKPTDTQVAKRLARRDRSRTPWREGAPLRRIEKAQRATEAAQRALIEAVQAARDECYSWTAIGLSLGGISKQAAQQRFSS